MAQPLTFEQQIAAHLANLARLRAARVTQPTSNPRNVIVLASYRRSPLLQIGGVL